jgi:hypothetical protein
MSRRCPLYHQKRTCAVQLQMSALGQKRTLDALGFQMSKAKQPSARDLKQHFFLCLIANNHKKYSVVPKHELGSSPHRHVIKGGDHVGVSDMFANIYFVVE